MSLVVPICASLTRGNPRFIVENGHLHPYFAAQGEGHGEMRWELSAGKVGTLYINS